MVKKTRVVIAMSGGVDSSTAACILKEQGYDVIGISMKLPVSADAPGKKSCCGIRGINDARSVAHQIGIPFYALNYEDEFKNKVIDYFCREYHKGRTPNPCVVCNAQLKFGSLLKKAQALGAKYIATGHYARIRKGSGSGNLLLVKGRDLKKDQSYFLYRLKQSQLKRTLFPLGDMTKERVRSLAKKFGLKVHDKPGSQEICFIPDNDYRGFIRRNSGPDKFRQGPIIDKKGNVVGRHDGIAFYTIGQRKGLGAYTVPRYVVEIDESKNAIIIGEDDQLFTNELCAREVNWVSGRAPEKPIKVKAKIRYMHPGSEATVTPCGPGRAEVRFKDPQRAVTPGQSAVFYKGDVVLGGGTIE
jgi:tRNA-uridine 2-sulfurtransferase